MEREIDNLGRDPWGRQSGGGGEDAAGVALMAAGLQFPATQAPACPWGGPWVFSGAPIPRARAHLLSRVRVPPAAKAWALPVKHIQLISTSRNQQTVLCSWRQSCLLPCCDSKWVLVWLYLNLKASVQYFIMYISVYLLFCISAFSLYYICMILIYRNAFKCM